MSLAVFRPLLAAVEDFRDYLLFEFEELGLTLARHFDRFACHPPAIWLRRFCNTPHAERSTAQAIDGYRRDPAGTSVRLHRAVVCGRTHQPLLGITDLGDS